MTDKAAREAFDPAEIERLMALLGRFKFDNHIAFAVEDVRAISDALRALAGYQAAHDAAMAAEPDAAMWLDHWRRERKDGLVEVFEAVLLQLQAAQQREAECRKETHELRVMLAVAHSGALLYHDDGELQDNRCTPFIDFKRDSVGEIQEKMLRRGVAALATQPTSKGGTTTPDSD